MSGVNEVREEAGVGRRVSDRRQYNRVMKWVRRVHMYTGILLMPWMLLYGITGFLLNHPGAFPDHEIRDVVPENLEGMTIAELPLPEKMADEVVQILNEKSPEKEYLLVNPERARYRFRANVNVDGEEGRYHLQLSPDAETGWIHIRPPARPMKTPVAGKGKIELSDSIGARLATDAVDILERHGIVADKIRNQWGPTLEFELADGEERWTVSYNVGDRSIGAWPATGQLRTESVRQFLLRLHFSHTFGAQMSQRDLWSVMVDLVAAAMVLWVLSGLLMWWQMKVVRVSGGIALIVSGLLACGLGYVMYEVFSH